MNECAPEKPKESRTVEDETASLEKELAGLKELIADFETRLEPVLVPNEKSIAENEDPVPGTPPLVAILQTYRGQLTHSIAALVNIQDRIALEN